MRGRVRGVMGAVIAAALLGGGASAAEFQIDPDWSIARVWNEKTLFAIRLSTPRPPVHARNLYHANAAMYDAWAVYDPIARGVFVHEKHAAEDVDAARREAISYAAYRVLKARYVAGNGPNIAQIQAAFDALFATLGYDKNFTSTVGNSPAAIGNRIAAKILSECLLDGSNEQNNYKPNNGYTVQNEPMPFKMPGTVMTNPDNWQQLAFDFLVLQNGEIIGAAIQDPVCPHWNGVTPFAMNDLDRAPNGLYFDQGPQPLIGSEQMKLEALAMIEHSYVLNTDHGTMIDISPAVYGNSPLGSYEQVGYGTNPVTGEPYPPNVVNLGDYARVVAEYWADGADSETPPGHWHVLGNMLSDHPLCEHRIFGEGPSLDRLEWDVKLYLMLGGAVHDAAITSWGMKGYYDSSRPISFVRYMGMMGQSSDPDLPSYHPKGLPLVEGLIRLVTEEDVAPGGELEDLPSLVYEPLTGEPIGINTHVGEVVVNTWLGGLYAGTTSGVQVTGPLPAHIYRTNSGWQEGDWHLGVHDTPGKLNPGLSRPRNIILSEVRNAQTGPDRDEYVEISGPPGASLDGVWFIVIGDEVQTGVPDSQGRVQLSIDLTGHTIGPSGVFLIGRSTLSLATPDLVHVLDLKEIGNTTYALVTNFYGYDGLELDWFDDGVLDFTPWDQVLDRVGLRRDMNPIGIYLGAPTVGPGNSRVQTYGTGWQLASHWMPYQASNFVTPPFPGYTSGHSTYSRSAAEALTVFTGSPYFPGGLMEYVIPAGWLKFEEGPTEDIVFQWVRFADCADQSGRSRIWGGIHPPVDDIPGRISGALTGKRTGLRIAALFAGYAQTSDINGDGVVDAADLAVLLGDWGSSTIHSDLNGDGVVNGFDLGILLGHWG